ncbi:GNAT family N-acetyltransferase [Lactiplantibacillus plantarum]|uniref:GNAT family N-acetyltransferase n=1 Tax=Lactiplantibacillus plantarum TaxID=1590 RepID=UPI001B8281F0|nr:N-acetyltransferase [Lactiplantibacillus plantarum]GIQ95777.1 acetyltransferase [Lactiplantibacillus plantarum]
MKTTIFKTEMTNSVDSLIRNAFKKSEHGYNGEAELTSTLRNSSTRTFERVVITDNKVVGHALLSEAKINQISGLVLAPISVLPEYQGKGVGSQLMLEIENIAQDNSYKFISILGDPHYYSRFGYKPASTYGVIAPMEVPEEVFMIKIFDQNNDYSGLLKYAPEFKL